MRNREPSAGAPLSPLPKPAPFQGEHRTRAGPYRRPPQAGKRPERGQGRSYSVGAARGIRRRGRLRGGAEGTPARYPFGMNTRNRVTLAAGLTLTALWLWCASEAVAGPYEDLHPGTTREADLHDLLGAPWERRPAGANVLERFHVNADGVGEVRAYLDSQGVLQVAILQPDENLAVTAVVERLHPAGTRVDETGHSFFPAAPGASQTIHFPDAGVHLHVVGGTVRGIWLTQPGASNDAIRAVVTAPLGAPVRGDEAPPFGKAPPAPDAGAADAGVGTYTFDEAATQSALATVQPASPQEELGIERLRAFLPTFRAVIELRSDGTWESWHHSDYREGRSGGTWRREADELVLQRTHEDGRDLPAPRRIQASLAGDVLRLEAPPGFAGPGLFYRRGGALPPAETTTPTTPPSEVPAAPPPEPEAAVEAPPPDTGPPAYLGEEARRLWEGSEDVLTADPDGGAWPEGDGRGRLRTWYGKTLPALNLATLFERRPADRLLPYCLRPLAHAHVRDPEQYGPGIAIRAGHDASGRIWTLWLRNDRTWHVPPDLAARFPRLAGTHPVTAADARFAFALLQSQALGASASSGGYADLQDVRVVDDACLQVVWRRSFPEAEALTLRVRPVPAFAYAFGEHGEPLPLDQAVARFAANPLHTAGLPITSGPYAIVAAMPDQGVTLARVGDLQGKAPPLLSIRQQVLPDADAAARAVAAGDLDGALLPPDAVARARAQATPSSPWRNGELAAHWVQSDSCAFIAWNHRHPFFQDARVRRALTMACDRRRILQVATGGRAVPVACSAAPGTPFVPPDLSPLPYDRDGAFRLLLAAGWRDFDGNHILDKKIEGKLFPFSFILSVARDSPFLGAMAVVRENLADVGVQVRIQIVGPDVLQHRLDSRHFGAAVLVWSSDGWEGRPRELWGSSATGPAGPANFVGFSDPDVDRLLDTLDTTFEFRERVAIQRRIHRRLAELQPFTWLFSPQYAFVYRRDRVGNAGAAGRWLLGPRFRFFPLTSTVR